MALKTFKLRGLLDWLLRVFCPSTGTYQNESSYESLLSPSFSVLHYYLVESIPRSVVAWEICYASAFGSIVSSCTLLRKAPKPFRALPPDSTALLSGIPASLINITELMTYLTHNIFFNQNALTPSHAISVFSQLLSRFGFLVFFNTPRPTLGMEKNPWKRVPHC